MTSLVGIIPPKVELCPSQSSDGRPMVYTTSDTSAVVPKPDIRFRTGDDLHTLPYTCTHYGNASANHSFALGTHRVVCRARDRRYGNYAVARCEFDIHVIGTKKRISVLLDFRRWREGEARKGKREGDDYSSDLLNQSVSFADAKHVYADSLVLSDNRISSI